MTATLKVLKHKQFWGCAALALLAGCAHQSTRLGPEHDPSNACFAKLVEDPVIQPLIPRIGPFGALSPTIEMRASKDYPTDEEQRMISYWGQKRQACHDAGVAFRSQNAPPFYRSALDWQTASLLGIMAKLYARDINYGQFIAERERIAAETRSMIAAGSAQAQQAESQLRQAQAAEANAAWAAVQATRPTPIVFQPIQVAPPPRAINCTTAPGIGNTVNTICR